MTTTGLGYDRDLHAVNMAWQVVRTKYGRMHDHDWEELVQIALVRVYERAKTFDPERAPWTAFVRMHAVYGIQDELRRLHGRGSTPSRKLSVVSMEQPIATTEDGATLHLAQILGYEDPRLTCCPFFLRNLRRAIGRLPGRQAEAARWMFADIGPTEAAEIMGITVNYSSVLRSWARAALRKDPALVEYRPSPSPA